MGDSPNSQLVCTSVPGIGEEVLLRNPGRWAPVRVREFRNSSVEGNQHNPPSFCDCCNKPRSLPGRSPGQITQARTQAQGHKVPIRDDGGLVEQLRGGVHLDSLCTSWVLAPSVCPIHCRIGLTPPGCYVCRTERVQLD